MNQIINTLLKMTIFKSNPQDLPPGYATVKMIIVGLILVNSLGLAMSGMLSHLIQSIIQIALIAGVVFLILKMKSLEERAPQTLSALFGVNIVFSLILLCTSLLFPVENISEQIAQAQNTAQPMSTYFLIFAFVGIWTFVVNAHILRNAIGCSFGIGLLWALFLSFSVLLSYMFFAPILH